MPTVQPSTGKPRPARKHIDLSYRPDSYFDDWHREAVADIHGRLKWRWIKRQLQDDRGAAGLLDMRLDREILAICPSLVDGSGLPSMLPGEVEIARVTLRTGNADQISVRARATRDGRIRYRVLDEGELPLRYVLPFRSTAQPLSLRELIKLLESVKLLDGAELFSTGLVIGYWEYWAREMIPQEAADFSFAYSMFYDQLGTWYDRRAQRWVQEKQRELEDDDEE